MNKVALDSKVHLQRAENIFIACGPAIMFLAWARHTSWASPVDASRVSIITGIRGRGLLRKMRSIYSELSKLRTISQKLRNFLSESAGAPR